MTRRRMSFRDAIDLVPDDLPDGAFWAMAHEMAGLDYGDGFDEPKAHKCNQCSRAFRTAQGVKDHQRMKHGEKE